MPVRQHFQIHFMNQCSWEANYMQPQKVGRFAGFGEVDGKRLWDVWAGPPLCYSPREPGVSASRARQKQVALLFRSAGSGFEAEGA